jgi:hypothetical protein
VKALERAIVEFLKAPRLRTPQGTPARRSKIDLSRGMV